MIRETSREAWEWINASGLLGKRQLAVYNWLYRNGPATAREVEVGLGDGDGPHKRLPELRRRAVVQELGKRACKETGRNAILWDVTASKPTAGGNDRGSPQGDQGALL